MSIFEMSEIVIEAADRIKALEASLGAAKGACNLAIIERDVSNKRIDVLEAALRQINKLNSHDRVQQLMRQVTANGELSDYDDEMANTCKIAAEVCDIARRSLED